MRCQRCRFDNRPGVRFCEECGKEIEFSCPRCGGTVVPGRRYCGHCGISIFMDQEEPSIQDGERKMVTVLFSDMVGYTRLFDEHDPEEVREILDTCFTKVAKVVEKYGGSIEKIIGDAIMAVFGLPEAHEDDPLRAIQSALEIHRVVERFGRNMFERLGRALKMHSGINTGLVITGRSLAGEGVFGVTGDTVNVASRLCDAAGPGEILVGYLTFVHAERLYDFRVREGVRIKGRKGTGAYEVIGQKRISPSIKQMKALKAKFTGRERELKAIKDQISSLKMGEGGIILIEGDVGLGKSRLVEEVKEYVTSERISWHEGRGYPIFNNIPYFIFRDFLAREWGIEWKDRPEEIREKIKQGLGLLTRRDISESQDLISGIYGLRSEREIQPDLFKSKVFDLMHEVFLALSRENPIVVCFEDLHWADPTSIELLRFLLSSFRFPYPALFILTWRPEFHFFTRHELQKKGSHCREIHLREFSQEESRIFLESLLKSRSIPSKFFKFIHTRAEGNPFFMEELVDDLIEKGIIVHDGKRWYIRPELSDIDCPPTVQELIISRIDRLGRDRKRIIQQGAVIGKSFLHTILKRVSPYGEELDPYLDDLENLHFLYSKQSEQGREYIFKNTFTHEVAYKSLLRRERRNYHDRVATVLESFSEDEERFCELIAYHWTRGTDLGKAVKYNVMAGEKNEKIHALTEAKEYYLAAGGILSSQREIPDRDHYMIRAGEGLWRCCRVIDAKVSLKALKDLVDLYEGMGNREASLFAQIRMLPHYSFLGQRRTCMKLYEKIKEQLPEGSYLWAVAGTFFVPFYIYEGDYKRAIDLIQSTRPFLLDAHPAILGMSKGCELSVMALMGNVRMAYHLGKELLDFFEMNNLLDMMASGRTQLLLAQIYGGDYRLAVENVTQCVLLQERMGGAAPLIARFLRTMGYLLYWDMGDIKGLEEVAISQREEAELFVDERSNPVMDYFNTFFEGLLLRAKGDIEGAIPFLRKALSLSHSGFPQRYPHSMIALAETLLETGRVEEAVEIAGRCRRFCLKTGDLPHLASSYRVRSIALMERGVFDEVEEGLRSAEKISMEMGLRPSLARTLQAWGLLWERRRDLKRAVEYYYRARDLWAEMENPYWKDKVNSTIACLS